MSDLITKGDEPMSFGVFDPIGYVVLAFGSAADLEQTRQALLTGGYDPADLISYTAEEVLAGTARTFPHRSALSRLGGERDAGEQHQELARAGYPFLLVHAPSEAEIRRVMTVAHRGDVKLAQKYDHTSVADLP